MAHHLDKLHIAVAWGVAQHDVIWSWLGSVFRLVFQRF
jgi:hypothetical protein